MVYVAISLGVFGLFGFFLAIVCMTRLKRLEERLRHDEPEQPLSR